MGRRKETTEELKESLSDALLDLLRDTPIEKIRMQDVADRAGVGRITFYRHFSSKQELIDYKLQALWNRYTETHQTERTDQWFFTFFYENRELLTRLYRLNLFSCTHDFIVGLFASEYAASPESRFAVAFLSYGLLGIVTTWAADGFRKSTEEVLALAHQYHLTDGG